MALLRHQPAQVFKRADEHECVSRCIRAQQQQMLLPRRESTAAVKLAAPKTPQL